MRWSGQAHASPHVQGVALVEEGGASAVGGTRAVTYVPRRTYEMHVKTMPNIDHVFISI